MFKSKSLNTLEKRIATKVVFESNLVKRCEELQTVPIGQLKIEDLRILIGQEIGLKFLIEIAIEKLQENCLIEGDLYPGDLLQSVLNINPNYWKENKKQKTIIENILKTNSEQILEADISSEIFVKS